MAGASPLWQQVLFVLVGPPIMAFWIRLVSRLWARLVQGQTISQSTKKRQKLEFWIVLSVLYIMGFCVLLYAHLRQ